LERRKNAVFLAYFLALPVATVSESTNQQNVPCVVSDKEKSKG